MIEVDLNLYEPERSKPERGSKLAQVRRFEAWLETLPLGNMTAAGNKLLAVLKELNQTELSPKRRAEMLDRIISPVLTVVGVLDKHFRDTTFPLDEKTDRVGRVAVEFFNEMALGYRIAARAAIGDGKSVGFLHKRVVGRCLHHSLAAMEQMLYRLALQYHPAPPQAWRQIQTVYVFARQNGLHEKTYHTELSLGGAGTTEDIFKRLALMGVSDPSRLGQRSIRALAQAVAPWAERGKIHSMVEIHGTEPGLFMIDPGNDAPPLLVTEDDVPKKFDMIFDIIELRDWLAERQDMATEDERELSFTDVDGKPLIIDRDLIRQLLATWGIRQERSFQRLPAQHEVRLLVGLNAIHFTSAGDNPFPRFLREYGDRTFAAAASRERAGFAASSDVQGRPGVYSAEVLNQSLGGYRLRISHVDSLQLRVGELVSLAAKAIAERDAVWMIGIVRWLNAIDVRELELGVSIVGQHARPAALLGDSSQSMPVRALVCDSFRRQGGGDGRRFLIVSGIWSEERDVALCAGGNDDDYCGRIEVTERLERTSEIARYSYVEKVPAETD